MNILITGGASGIGLELARQLSERGESVTVVCRKKTPELSALNVRVFDGVDLTALNLEARLQELFGNQPIDWLINNAGVFEDSHLGEINFQQLRDEFEVNTIAPLRVVQALLKNLKQGSKIGMVSSRMGSVEDNTSGGYYAYRISKAGLNMASKSLANDLEASGVSVAILHPGYVKTKLTGFHGEISPEVSAQGLIKIMDSLSLENSGGFWHTNGEELPW
jgi:NAD(P)-dependent dehydrogenase (short-subunit alcohol dehydrogenase family)